MTYIISMEYKCKKCDKIYSSYQSLWIHNKKFHSEVIINKKIWECSVCKKILSCKQSRWRHEQNCKNSEKAILLLENNKLKEENLRLQNFEKNANVNVNNQLINVIVDKVKTIEELKKQDHILQIENNFNFVTRNIDNYFNATLICKAGNKDFNDWYSLEITKQLIKDVICNNKLLESQVIDNKENEDIWIHPDLVFNLTNWISFDLGVKFIKWIKNPFINSEIKTLEEKIKLLENTFNKKQKRQDYPGENVVYILTTNDNKNKRTYIIGKAKQLKQRLSTYNKTTEHEVIYYKVCGSENLMNIIESLVLIKLELFREQANRDRFILPIDKDISFFTKIIDECVMFIEK